VGDDIRPDLTALSEAERALALERFKIILPILEKDVSLRQVALDNGILVRTIYRWVQRYKKRGFAGLARQYRKQYARSLSREFQQLIEGLALQNSSLSITAIHRKAIIAAKNMGIMPPSYRVVRSVIDRIKPSLMKLAREGTKAYSESYDLIYRREAVGPNAIWQADHTQLDILVKNEDGDQEKPWLTVVLDDYSRAVAGYVLSFSPPSAIQTALALRQAIWRKAHPNWHVCGIPQILYTDHGSDFVSRHIEQVAADLKIQLVFSAVGRPRGRGKIERFFSSLSQMFLSNLPGFACSRARRSGVLTLPQLGTALEHYIIDEYLSTPHSSTKVAPRARWEANGFLPQMPESLQSLDLLLLTVAKTRQIRPDGIWFNGMRYIDPTLAAYVGETVLLRYDPRDMAEIRVFFKERFLCRAVCQELAGETVTLREIVGARNRQRRQLQQVIQERQQTVDALIEARRWTTTDIPEQAPPKTKLSTTPKLKRYRHE